MPTATLPSPSVRAEFRLAGRRMLRDPRDPAGHQARVDAACALAGAEPLQGALADLLHACWPDPARLSATVRQPAVRSRLAPFVARALERQADAGRRLARVSPLATRWSLIATPSFDVPRRAVLCGTDDSRALAMLATPRLLAGQAGAEDEFLDHCEGAIDTQAFMLVRRALQKHGRLLAARWDSVAQALQPGEGR